MNEAIPRGSLGGHFVYGLRQPYGEFRFLHEAPGHLCLEYEGAEIVTLVELSLLFGWDAHPIPVAGYARALLCHDGWIEIAFDAESQMNGFRQELEQGQVEILAQQP